MRYTDILLIATTSGAIAAGLENRGLLACVDTVAEHRSVTMDLPTLSATGIDEDDIPTITKACDAQSSELSAVWSACKDEDFVGKITSLAENYGPVCSAVADFSHSLDETTVVVTTTAAGTAATETGVAATDTRGAAAAATTSLPNAASREAGIVMVAVAAAGVVFAVIHLERLSI
ncbi:uncharacterized protein CCOS01_08408 [Colletotrichum costaricense]|uniref:Infection structure specific protein n=1 Tax=Colletotrichum costaricense TaxID=1209916 RepID=A0AAI9YWE0_9PEZI|nr:uncharacterized protein CCOS01_08408 [Colletotrichum costaricense]KAK1525990.1 hypothetical protein CCOS01_08408 [Colletotrichum costaricense]